MKLIQIQVKIKLSKTKYGYNVIIGSLSWGEKTQGKLTLAESFQFLPTLFKGIFQYLLGRFKLAFGLRSKDTSFDLNQVNIPTNELAVEIEKYCKEKISDEILNHSYRTFAYAWALKSIDNIQVDHQKLFYACILHDICLEIVSNNKCFALVSGETARNFIYEKSSNKDLSETIGNAVAMHLNPEIDSNIFPEAYLVAQAALLDITGHRVWELSSDFVDQVLDRWPRLKMKSVMSSAWKAQTKAFTSGRAGLIEKASNFSIVTKLAPFKG